MKHTNLTDDDLTELRKQSLQLGGGAQLGNIGAQHASRIKRSGSRTQSGTAN